MDKESEEVFLQYRKRSEKKLWVVVVFVVAVVMTGLWFLISDEL